MSKITALVIERKPTAAEQKIIDIAKGLTDMQRYALQTVVTDGEEVRQEKGRKNIRPGDCVLETGYRSVVSTSTIRSLQTKDLIAFSERKYRWHLTPLGVKVGIYAVEKWWCEKDEEATTIEEYVTSYMASRREEQKRRDEKLKRAKRLWRGLSFEYIGKRKAFSTEIEEAFGDGDHYKERVRLNLDDMIDLGEQIEKMR